MGGGGDGAVDGRLTRTVLSAALHVPLVLATNRHERHDGVTRHRLTSPVPPSLLLPPTHPPSPLHTAAVLGVLSLTGIPDLGRLPTTAGGAPQVGQVDCALNPPQPR